MSLLQNVAVGLRSLFQKEQVSHELDEELNGFLDMAAAEKMKNGLSHKDALRADDFLRDSDASLLQTDGRCASTRDFISQSWTT